MKVIIAGDYSPRGHVQEAIDKEDYCAVFGSIKPIIEKADYSIVNFETTIADETDKPIMKSGPHLKCKVNAVYAIKYAGFKCLTLANNHFRDYGDSAVLKSIETIDNSGLDRVGGGISLAEASRTLYKKIGNEMLAIINACEHEFSIAAETTGGSNPLDSIQQYYAIKEAKAKADYVIVIIHGGHERYQLPSTRMQETYRFFVDAGADAIVNHHQHCYSGFEIYNEKPIFYGLGNFCFEEFKSTPTPTNWNYGFILELMLENNKIGFKMLPYIQCFNSTSVDLIVNREYFDAQVSKLNVVIADKIALKQEAENFYIKDIKRSKVVWEPYNNRAFKLLYYLNMLPSFATNPGIKLTTLFNCINCESHKDKMLHVLKHCNK